MFFAIPAVAQDDADELAKQLANPVADLASFPFQFNYDTNIGPNDDGKRFTLNIQPVIPFELNNKWILLSRTIVPVMYQDDIVPGAGSKTGLSDTVQSLFFSPHPGPSGLIWGVGPVLLLPTASDDELGTEKWGAGPTGVVLKQTGPWTYGGLANHIGSYAGSGSRADISSTFLNPFLSRVFHGGWTLGIQLEHTLDHENDQDSGMCAVFLSKVTQIGSQMVSFGIVPKYWYEDSASSPEGFGIRCSVVFLFPRKGR
ncbi:MAG: transporter [Desulfatitalea sp.]|nr:transporter [Desulfatitalea sp.]